MLPLPHALVWALLGLRLVDFQSPPLHAQIDRLIAARQGPGVAVAPLASDAEFLRRIYLDLTGTIPTAIAARAFLDDPSPRKRRELVERLLASPEFARHMAQVFDVLLMERRPATHVPQAAWREYLRASFASNKPWDQLVRELLSADGADATTRPAARFVLDREADPHVLTRDVARLFLGLDLQCAQCHDHPLVEDYKQSHYYGLFAFFSRTALFTGNDKLAVLAEKADGDVTFQSVFDPAKLTKSTGPRLPGLPPVPEPKVEKGKQYGPKPANGRPPAPTYSRRAQLAGRLTGRDDVAFRRNSVNRLWALMMGRGLVMPLELDHSANPPSHPELLTLLADRFAAMKYDARAFLRELALTQTYQRSSVAPSDADDAADTYAVALLKPQSPEQLAWSLMQATGLTEAERQALGGKGGEGAVLAKLEANERPFVRIFGGAPGQPEGQGFQATLDQALFLRNSRTVLGWLAPRPGNLTDRLAKLPTADAIADELYLAVLTRRPAAEERQAVAAFLKERTKDRAVALQELAWALLASAEFRFNH